MNLPIELMVEPLLKKGIMVDDIAKKRFVRYAELLCEWNQKINLTAITDPEGIVIKHFLDSAFLLTEVNLPEGAKVVDVGTGAGFPGMVLKILRPDLDITLMDGLNKRLVFLNEVARELSLEVKTIHIRAEEAGKKPEFREQFDLVTARAVAQMNTLYEYCLPLCKAGGIFCAMKGPSAAEELKIAGKAAGILGGGKAKVSTSTLTGEEVRTFVITKKISQTPPKYPRASAKIAKQPL